MSWAGRWLPRAYFGVWFGDATGSTGPAAAGPPFVWTVAADGQAFLLPWDQALAAIAADGWQAQLVEFVDAALRPDGWASALGSDLATVMISDNPTAALAADIVSR